MKKILIVDDELEYLNLLRIQLIENGYSVIEAKNGKEGLRIALVEHPNLILLDINMPIMNGMDMLEALRRDEDGRSIKVILLTNLMPDDEVIRKVVKEVPTYYLIKSDIQFNELLEKIQNLLQ